MGSLLRFRDLKSRKIVSNHVTLKRWIDKEGFSARPNAWAQY